MGSDKHGVPINGVASKTTRGWVYGGRYLARLLSYDSTCCLYAVNNIIESLKHVQFYYM